MLFWNNVGVITLLQKTWFGHAYRFLDASKAFDRAKIRKGLLIFAQI